MVGKANNVSGTHGFWKSVEISGYNLARFRIENDDVVPAAIRAQIVGVSVQINFTMSDSTRAVTSQRLYMQLCLKFYLVYFYYFKY